MQRSSRLFAYLVPYIFFQTLQYPFAKDGLRFASPLVLMALRYSIAALVTFSLTRSFRPILNRDTLLLSIFTAFSTVFWIFGLELVSPAQSAVLSYTMPLLVIPLSTFILKERAAGLAWIGAAVGFSGVLVYGLGLTNSGGSVVGGLLTVANALFWGLFTISYRKVRNQDPTLTVATQFLICALFFWLVAPIGFTATINSEFVLDLVYISIMNGVVGFLLWNAMVRMETVVRLTPLIFAVPAATVVVQAVMTGIVPGWSSMAGVGIMFLGIFISRTRSSGTGSGKENLAGSNGRLQIRCWRKILSFHSLANHNSFIVNHTLDLNPHMWTHIPPAAHSNFHLARAGQALGNG
jgi:drug/metabolite transporter (DMT)-like permease